MPTFDRRSRRRARRAVARRLPVWAAALAVFALAACSGEAPLPGDPLRLVASPLPDAIRGEPYQEDLVPTGGLRPYAFTLEEGALPPGLALQGGTIIGTPEETGRFAFTVSVSDARLSTTYQDWVLTVRELPVPVFDLAVPDTEVRGEVVLRGGVREARELRALRVRIEWQDPAVSLGADAVQASRDDVALFVEPRENGLAIDLAVLGEPLTGDAELFRLTLNAGEATVLGVDARSEVLYSGRHAFDESRIGAPRTAQPADPDEEPGEADGAGEAEPQEDGEDGTEAEDPAEGDADPSPDADDADPAPDGEADAAEDAGTDTEPEAEPEPDPETDAEPETGPEEETP